MGSPQYRIDIHKLLGAEEWSNTYLTDDPTLLDAQDLASGLLAFEKQLHHNNVLFTFIRISTVLVDDRVFRHLVVNETGIPSGGDFLPLFNTARMDMQTSSSDPARKYYRLPLSESDQVSGFIAGAYMTALNGAIASHLVTPGLLDHIVTNAGNTVISAAFMPAVQMRQLHRRKRHIPTP